MIKSIALGVLASLSVAGAAAPQSCTSYPNTLTNGATADASQVMGNFNCAAVLGNARFTNPVGINNSTITTGAMLSITPTGNGWNEGIEINPSTANGYSALSFRTNANSITGSWEVFMANTTDPTGSHSLGISMNGLTGMTGTGRVDTPFTIATTGVARFGAGVGIGTSDLGFAGTISSAFTVNGAGNTAIAAGYSPTVGAFALNPGPSGGWAIYDHGSGTWNVDLVAYDGNIGLGTSSPRGRLDVQGTAYSNNLMLKGDNTNAYVQATNSGSSLYLGYAGGTLVTLSSGTPQFYVNGTAGGTSSWAGPSDARLKKDVIPVTGALETIERLRAVRYHWRAPSEREVGKTLNLPLGQAQIGFIAQEVSDVVPEAVVAPTRGTDEVYTLKEDTLIPLLVEAVKTQHAEIEQLRAEITALKAR